MKSDAQIQADVQNELRFTPQVNAPEIGVSVDNGIVTLSGNVPTYAQKVAAEAAAMRVKGVRAVAEEIKIGPSFGLQKTDKEIAQAILGALAWYTTLDESRIHIKVDKGVVTLEGEVDWEFQRRAASNAIQHLAGVVWISNRLTLKPATTPADVRSMIGNAFKRNAILDADHIKVEISGSKVMLTGAVRSLLEKSEAAAAAWSAPGITGVDNRLEVREMEHVH